MTRLRKYLIIILSMLAAMLCAAGVSTWIISTPKIITPQWEAAQPQQQKVYVKKIVETTPDETVTGSYLSNTANKKLEFSFEDGKDASSAIQSFDVGTANSGGAVPNVEFTNGDEIKVGCTYSVSVLDITFVSTSYSLAGTYQNGKEGGLDGIEESSSINIILKHKTVDVSGTLYTIEDALAQNGNATVKADTAFTGKSVANQVGYTSSNYTVASGETLLLPFSDSDTEGYIHPTWNFGGDTSNLPGDTKGATLYQTLTVPAGISVSNAGTITVGAFTGQKGNGHIGGISGGYAAIDLNGTISSSGTLNVYGNITGKGTINATAGTVLERMEIVNWEGGTNAGARFVGNGSVPALKLVFDKGSVIEIENPNEFPFEDYILQAISGPTLTVNYGAVYEGNARIFTGQLSKAGQDIPPMLSIANLRFVNAANNNTADGLIGLKNGGTAIKKIDNNRSQITITGGMVGGIAALNMDLLNGSIKMDTAKVKFPIPKSMDIILDGGSSSSVYGYEIMEGATVTLKNNAALTLDNTEDGTIAYGGGGITVDSNCILTLKGKFGGKISGEDTAILDFQATPSNTGYIGGTGSYEVNYGGAFTGGGIDFTFKCDETNVNATGPLFNGQGQFASGTKYTYLQGAWRTPSSYTVVYHANGNNVTKDGTSFSEESTTIDNVLLGATYSDWLNQCSTPIGIARAHYAFGGWSLFDGTPVIDKEGNLVKADVTVTGGGQLDLYAVWTPVEYNITYDMDNYVEGAVATGDPITNENPATFNIESNITLIEPIDGDLVFDSWYLDASFTTSVNSINGAEILQNVGADYAGLTLYGRWYPAGTKAYTVTYHNNSADYPDSSETVLSTNTTSWSAPKRDGKNNDPTYEYYFAGWFTDAGCTEQFNGTLTDNTDLYAKWENKIQVVFKADEANGKIYEHSAGWYYGPATIAVPDKNTMEFSDYYNTVYYADDEDVTKEQYFYGWTVKNGTPIAAGGTYNFSKDDAVNGIIEFSACTAKKASLNIALKDEYGEAGILKYYGTIKYTIQIGGSTVASGEVAKDAGTDTFTTTYYLHGDQLTNWSISITIEGGYTGPLASDARGRYIASSDNNTLTDGEQKKFTVTLKVGTLNGTLLSWDTNLEYTKQ